MVYMETNSITLANKILTAWEARFEAWRAGRQFSPSAHDLAIDACDAFDGDHDAVDPLADLLYQTDEATGATLAELAATAAVFLTTRPICPGCAQHIIVTDTTECGGEGEGICCVMADDDEPCDFHPQGHDPQLVAAAHAAHVAAFGGDAD